MDVNKPSLVISDINMPEMNGYEFCRQIKANPDLDDIPVILLTSLNNMEDVLEGLACGADNFITKPYSVEHLLTNINRTMAESETHSGDQRKVEVEIQLAGQSRVISADPQRMLSLLLSTYEAAVQRNNELVDSQDELRALNEHLEELVEIRTASLSAEIVERNEREAILKKVQGIAHLGSWEIDLATKTAFASEEAHRIYGAPKGSMTLLYIQSMPLPEYRPILDAALTALITEGKRYDVDFKIQRRSDGEIRDIHSSAEYSPVNRKVTGFIQDITESKQAEESIRQRVMELETINRISLELRSVTNQDELLSIILDEALAMLNTPHGSIELHNKTKDTLDKTVARGWTAGVSGQSTPSGEGIAGKVFTNGEVYISREFAIDPQVRFSARNQIPSGWGGVCLPIRTTEQTLGVLLASVPSQRELNQNEIRLLSILSELTGAALQRMQLNEQTIHRLEQLNGLRAVDQAIASSRDMQLTLNILLTNTISQLKVDAADVLLLHTDSTTLELVAGRGFHTLQFESINMENSVAWQAIMDHRSLVTLDLESILHIDNPGFMKFWKVEGFRCYWCVPLVVKGEVKGALEVYRREAFTPDTEWLEFLEALAGQAAITIDSAQLFTNLQRSNLDLNHAYDATIEGWSRAMDLRDHETEGHSQRVTELTLKLARAMHVNDSQLTAIRRGALLHDIGKMGIPDSILLKAGKLTDEEWDLMRKHPQLAWDLLAPIAYLNDALNIPYCHHERWDGTGYPQGLKGEHIPLMARIFAIIDVWDALTNDRPYRDKWSNQKALQHIQEQSGRHFDPQVVNAFLVIIKDS
jgi:PAS domain S-box-containing protein